MLDPVALDRAGYVGRLLSCSLLWASGFLLMKLAGDIHPVVTSAARASIATVALIAWLAWQGEAQWPSRAERGPWLLLGTLNGWLPNVLTAYALLHAPAGLSAMIQASSPLVVAIFAHGLFPEERLTARRAAGVVLGFVGLAVLIGPRAWGGGAELGGILAMMGVALCYATGNIISRNFKGFSATRLALGQQSVSATASLLIALVATSAADWDAASRLAPALVALGVVSTALPIAIFMSLIKRFGPTRAAMNGYLTPVWATLMGVAVLGETIGLREAGGAAIVLAGIVLVTTSRRPVPA